MLVLLLDPGAAVRWPRVRPGRASTIRQRLAQWLVCAAADPQAAGPSAWQFPAVGPGSVEEYQARALAEVNLEAEAKRKREGEVAA